jgi:hypothetical protein
MTCWNFKTKTIQALGHMPDLTENEKSAIERMLR